MRRTSLTDIAHVLDPLSAVSQLSPRDRRIVRDIANGEPAETAGARAGVSVGFALNVMRRLRLALAEQALDNLDQLTPAARARVEELVDELTAPRPRRNGHKTDSSAQNHGNRPQTAGFSRRRRSSSARRESRS